WRRGNRELVVEAVRGLPAGRLRSGSLPYRDHVMTSCRNNQAWLGDYGDRMATVVSLEGKRKGPSLEPLLSLCADDMAQVDREILARMRSPVALIPELANHLVGAGGKRMGPLLTVAAARLWGYS